MPSASGRLTVPYSSTTLGPPLMYDHEPFNRATVRRGGRASRRSADPRSRPGWRASTRCGRDRDRRCKAARIRDEIDT